MRFYVSQLVETEKILPILKKYDNIVCVGDGAILHKDLIKEMNRIENLLNHIKKHRRLYSKLVMIVSMMY